MKGYRLERQFGWSVGAVFLAIGLWTMWRGRWPLVVGQALAAGGFLLVALGTVAPRALTHPRRAWMALAEALGFVSTRVILGLVFFVIITPLGLVMRRFGWDPLASRRPEGPTSWVAYSPRQANVKHFEQMF